MYHWDKKPQLHNQNPKGIINTWFLTDLARKHIISSKKSNPHLRRNILYKVMLIVYDSEANTQQLEKYWPRQKL